jgi:adenylosuccinate synthase
MTGWETEVSGVRRKQDLPAGALRFLDRVAELIGRPVGVISVGPGREQTIFA